MKRKFLAVVITAAMVAGAPGLVLAAPAAEDTSEIQTVQQTEDIQESDTEGLVETEEVPETPEADRQEETPAMQEAGEISGTQEVQSPDAERNTAVETAGVSASADVIDTEQELADAIAQGGEINLTGQRIELTSPLYVNNDVVIKGGTLVGTDSVTGNLVTLMGNKVTLEGVMIRTSAGNKSALHVYGTDLTVNDLTIDHSSAAGGAPVIINNGAEAVFNGDVKLTLGSSSWYGINVDNAKADFSGAALNVTPVTDTQSVICSEGDDASVTGAGFTVVVTEKDGEILSDRSYIATAITRTDGNPMPENLSDAAYDNMRFFISPLIQGCDPMRVNIVSMDGVYTEFVQDGTLYRLTECSNIEIFADRTVYLCVSDADQSSAFGYNEEAYTFDNTTGAISRRENYEGVNALFVLPLDKELADPEAAEEYLSALEPDEESGDDYAAWSREADAFMSEITPENIEQYADRIEESVHVFGPEEDEVWYDYTMPDGEHIRRLMSREREFPDGRTGMSDRIAYFDYEIDALKIVTFTLNKDGTVTGAVYIPKEFQVNQTENTMK